MEYQGKLYGHVAGQYFEMKATTEDFDECKRIATESVNKLIAIDAYAKTKKETHELPNDNGHDYNRGYVQAMNDIINFQK